MKIIGWHLLRLAAELDGGVVGMAVESIRRHANLGRLMLIFGSPRGKRYLILGARGHSAFFWTQRKEHIFEFEAYLPTELFNRLRGARLTAVHVPRPDRLVELHWARPTGDAPEMAALTLVLSWTGRAGNILLLNPADQAVLESAYRSTPDADKPHAAARGTIFVSPAPPRLVDWRTLTFPEYLRLRRENADLPALVFWHRHLWGIDAALASQIAQRIEVGASGANPTTESAGKAVYWNEFEGFLTLLRAAVTPETMLWLPVGEWDAENVIVGVSQPAAPAGATTGPLALIHALCDLHSGEADQEHEASVTMRKAIDARQRQLTRQITTLQRTVDQSGEPEKLHHWGDLLGANRQLLQRGLKDVTVTDWDKGAPVTIPLDPSLAPQENIAAIYNRARKLAQSIERARATLAEALRQQNRWEAVRVAIENQTADDVLVARTAKELHIRLEATAARREPSAPRLPYREFALGVDRVWVGRSSRDNDELTLHHARPDDLFFHAQGCPGSHVILRRSRREVDFDHQTIIAAAQIAAFFSRAKHAGLVPVSYAEVRYVKKPRKAPPGTVRLAREISVMVTPQPPPGYHDAGRAEQ